jgi:hypothetical protein
MSAVVQDVIHAPSPDKAEIVKALNALFESTDVIELRAFHKGRKRTDAGYFDGDHRDELAEEAKRLSTSGAAVYVALNRLDPQLLGCYANRVEHYAQATATDANIIQRRWLLLDVDPSRPKDTSATEEQLTAAKDCARRCYQALKREHWPEPLAAESGNGMHLLYPLDLPNDTDSRDLIKGALAGLAGRFDRTSVSVDQAVFNAARIVKLYGTVANKGDHTAVAPWRLSRLITKPRRDSVVTPDQLRALHLPHERSVFSLPPYGKSFDLEGFLSRLSTGYRQDAHEGSERYKLDHCPFNAEHGRGEAAIFRKPDGTLGFKCQHNSCADKHWQDLRALIDGPRETRTGPTSGGNHLARSQHRTGSDNAPTGAVEAETIKRLAALTTIEYDRCREKEAKALGIRVATLDAEVARLRPRSESTAETGAAVLFEEPEPWPDPVDGAALLDAIAETLTLHAVLPAHADTAIALWIMLTYTHEAASVCPILELTSPEKRCGKTTVLSLLRRLCHRPLAASNITAAALFRAVEQWQPCLLIDEADTFLRQSDELRGVINSGHTRDTAYVIRTVGEQHEPRRFATWCPKAIACIGGARDTIMDRSIVISMRRKLPTEMVTRLRYGDRYADLVSQCVRWAADHMDTLRGAEPHLTSGLHDRAADNWIPLLAIAEAAGGHWLDRAREAARILSGGEAVEDTSTRVQLLADIHSIFDVRGVDRIRSTELVAALADMEDRPWPEWKNGKPITPTQLAQLLRPFGIVRGTRRDGRDTFKGYYLRQFGDAFSRYLPAQTVTRSQPPFQSHSVGIPSGHTATNVTAAKTQETAPHNGCDRVTAPRRDNGARVWTKPTFEVINREQSEGWSTRI